MSENTKNNTIDNTVCLDIDRTGPHYEHMKDFKDSFFKSVYERAFLQLDHIIGNFENSRNGLALSTRGYYESDKVDADSSYEGFPNIITFSGKRGSGKSSAMLSFMEALKHYYSYKRMTNDDLPFTLSNAKRPLFSCLDCIDGSLLEHGEDIFKIVLAQMYQKFIDLDKDEGIYKDEDFAYRKRELLHQLENIYRTVCDIESMGNNQTLAGESYMSSLQSLSSSQKVKRDFEELIKKFTSLMKYERPGLLEESSEHYLVITIDDIDLNVSNGFSMLEKIHRYCMVQNVIVLLSVDIEQMLSIVSKSFYKVLPEVDKLLCAGEDRVHELAIDYIDKVMPVNYRLYMPDLRKYYSSYGVSVKKEQSGIKKSVFWKLYRRIGIYFDSQGIKQHFYEPKSMRQLTCFYLMLNAMKYTGFGMDYVYGNKKINETEIKHFIGVWEENYRVLTSDLANRVVLEKLYTDKDAVKLCEMIEKEDIRRAKDEVVNFYYAKISLAPEKGCPCPEKNQHKSVKNLMYMENCSYGQLVEAIYMLGRIERGRFKSLVHYLLGYFSYAFTRTYIYEKVEVKSDGDLLVEKDTFRDLIGENIVDSWSNALMPNTVGWRNRDVEEKGTITGDISNKKFEYYSNIKGATLTQALSFPIKSAEEVREEKYKYVAELIGNIELVFLFFSNIREEQKDGIFDLRTKEWGFKSSFEIDGEGEERIGFMPKMEGFENIKLVGDFNVLNFVGNSLNATETLEKVEKELISCLASKYDLRLTEHQKEFNKELKIYSLKTQFEKWEKKFGQFSLPLPLFWFDFTYNVLKRVKRTINEEPMVSVDIKNMFAYIRKLYETILAQLEKQNEFYTPKETREKNNADTSGTKEKSYPYQLPERFKECPVVEYFLEVDKGNANAGKNSEILENRKAFMQAAMGNIREFSKEK